MEQLRKEISTLLQSELERRKQKNKLYSLRAYANQLQVEPSLLSKIIRQQITPKPKTLDKLIASLTIHSEEKDHLSKEFREFRDSNVKKYQQGKTDFYKIKSDQSWPFESWTELVIFSTLGLAPVTGIKELVLRLDIKETTLKLKLNRLKSLGLIEQGPEGFSLKIKQVSDDIPSATNNLKKNIQKEFLNEAIRKMDSVGIDKRLNGTLTFALDPKLLPKVKKKIARFMTELNGFSMSESQSEMEIHNLTIALYPLKRKKT